VEKNRYYWALIGILGIVAESAYGLVLTPNSIRFPNGEEITGAPKVPLVMDGDGNILGRLVGLGYNPGSHQVDVMTDQGYILRIQSNGEVGRAYSGEFAYGGPYRDANCELEEFVINAMNDIQNNPPIVRLNKGVYQDSIGNLVFIRKDAEPHSLIYYSLRWNADKAIVDCQLVTDDLTEFYSNWYGVGGPDHQVLDILPNNPSVTGFPGVAGENYPLTTPIEVVY
jgi:hypothetical protein